MERRLAAILAADVVGYSRLMAADERGTHTRLKALRQDFIEPKVAEHRGRTVKLMGDGALVEFASIVDAVECAAALQQGVAERQAGLPEAQRIAFRIGINLGNILIEDDDIYGDGVNVAARLEALAPPGGICVARGQPAIRSSVNSRKRTPRSRRRCASSPISTSSMRSDVAGAGVWQWRAAIYWPRPGGRLGFQRSRRCRARRWRVASCC